MAESRDQAAAQGRPKSLGEATGPTGRGEAGGPKPSAAKIECDHDWRVDPNVILPTNPPQRRLMCAKCKRSKPSGITAVAQPNTDPNGWEKWNG